jgi:quercetin dioxygenase-like cupin family protein
VFYCGAAAAVSAGPGRGDKTMKGSFRHYLQDPDEYQVLTPGSTWFQKGNAVHGDTCVGDDDCILSIFWPHGFDVTFIENATL